MYKRQILVFDAYKVKGGVGSVERRNGIYVVYTKEAETADAYIEKTTYDLGKDHRVRVATSDGMEQWIILGLSEKNGFTPVEGFDARAMQEALSQACEKMTPVVRPVIVTCPFEGANLVFARIDEMLPRDKPCFTTALGPHGGSFIRTGDGDRRMTSYEVDRLIEEHLQPTYDLDIVPGATTDDLDPQLVAGLLARVREQHPRVFADRDGIDVLLDLQVLRHDDSDESEVGGILRPTLAGLLALGRYPQKFYPRLGISIAVFPGTSRDDVFRGDERLVASKSVVGSIPVMIDDAVDSLMRWIGAKKPDYPPLAVSYTHLTLPTTERV